MSAGAPDRDGRRALRDGLLVAVGGQVERVVGTLTTLALRWWLDPARLGVYTGLRLYLDNTNRSSLGVGLGAVQEIPILLASGREAEARRVEGVAHTANTLTCLAYAAALAALAWAGAAGRASDPLAREWTYGLVAVAGLALMKRYESFLIAVLRARREFGVTTKVDLVEAAVSAVAVSIGLRAAGFWGLLGAVGVVVGAKIAYLHATHPLRFSWCWDWPIAARLMRVGLPILANTAVFGAVMTVDRVVILNVVPDADRAVGLYTVAILGTSWSLDLAGRLVTVLYPYLQTTLGRTGDRSAVAGAALRATLVQAPILMAGGAIAYVVAPDALGWLVPRYRGGLGALRPLVPGAVALAMAWPARQLLITVGRPYRLAAVTALGLGLTASLGAIGAARGGIVGVAAGTSVGYGLVASLTFWAAFGGLGARAIAGGLARLAAWSIALGLAAISAARVSLDGHGPRPALIRATLLMLMIALPLAVWASRAIPRRRDLIVPMSTP